MFVFPNTLQNYGVQLKKSIPPINFERALLNFKITLKNITLFLIGYFPPKQGLYFYSFNRNTSVEFFLILGPVGFWEGLNDKIHANYLVWWPVGTLKIQSIAKWCQSISQIFLNSVNSFSYSRNLLQETIGQNTQRCVYKDHHIIRNRKQSLGNDWGCNAGDCF